ncbi:MAG: S41 family peptidase [Phycisphaeraceae bacterium]|nr:S41 family peptidase [Phycisphaeraceae bacterium]
MRWFCNLGRTLRLALWLAAALLLPRIASADPGAAKLADCAKRGDFAAVLQLLQTTSPSPGDPAVASLIGHINQYQQHVADALATRQKNHDEAMAKVRQEFEAGKIEDALIAAIDAHALAAEPTDVLNDPVVSQVISQARQRAAAVEQEGDWVEALNLYRELDLLFEEQGTYRDDLRRTARHIRVLQLYAPQQLEKLYLKYAERRDDDQPLRVEPEAWQRKLEQVSLPMLRQALAQAARKHIDAGGYSPLMKGAVANLKIVLNTDALSRTFPGLADRDKLTRFRDELDRIRAQLDSNGSADIHYLDTLRLIERILNANRDTVNLPEQVVVYELAEGAIGTLDDFSAVIWPDDVAEFSRSTQGTFTGVGIQIRRNGKLIVVSPLPNTPAQRAGIKAGDVIATVDGLSTDAWSLDRAVNEITGEVGTTVTLGIERTGLTELIDVPIRRERIAIESILGWQRDENNNWSYWLDRQSGIGYVRLTQFIPQTADDLDAAVAQLIKDPNFSSLILDLRFNPGGLLSSAIDISDRFISQGTIVSTVSADGGQNDERSADARNTYPRFPLVVLINQGSASASEIVSGALQDYHRATIVGARSFGKGSVQDLFPLEHGEAYLKLTTQYYRLPGGRIIHHKPDATTWGIEPDVVVEMTDHQVAEALQMRQDLDVIRDTADTRSEPLPVTSSPPDGRELDLNEMDLNKFNSDAMPPDESAADTAVKPADESPATQQRKPAVTASALLDDGVDLQLESALLLLRTQLFADHVALASSK